jgi:hypothetical protein
MLVVFLYMLLWVGSQRPFSQDLSLTGSHAFPILPHVIRTYYCLTHGFLYSYNRGVKNAPAALPDIVAEKKSIVHVKI